MVNYGGGSTQKTHVEQLTGLEKSIILAVKKFQNQGGKQTAICAHLSILPGQFRGGLTRLKRYIRGYGEKPQTYIATTLGLHVVHDITEGAIWSCKKCLGQFYYSEMVTFGHKINSQHLCPNCLKLEAQNQSAQRQQGLVETHPKNRFAECSEFYQKIRKNLSIYDFLENVTLEKDETYVNWGDVWRWCIANPQEAKELSEWSPRHDCCQKCGCQASRHELGRNQLCSDCGKKCCDNCGIRVVPCPEMFYPCEQCGDYFCEKCIDADGYSCQQCSSKKEVVNV